MAERYPTVAELSAAYRLITDEHTISEHRLRPNQRNRAMKYFIIMQGLRGCYMPDNVGYLAFATRRGLKEYLLTHHVREEMFGITERDCAWAAAKLWRGTAAILPYGSERRGGRPFILELSVTTRKDFLEREKEDHQ